MLSETSSSPGAGVTLNNWQTPEQLAWSFQHIADILPTAVISRAAAPTAPFESAPAPVDELPLVTVDGRFLTVREVMDWTYTDGWLVEHDGRLLAEHYPSGMAPGTRHLLMSVSKSLVSLVAGSLWGAGLLHPDAPVTAYVPQLAYSGYAGATVRQLLDMRTGVRFSEEYTDPDAEVRQLEEAIGWKAWTHPGPRSMYEFLLGLQKVREHGGLFEYRSAETDVLGWICEAAGGARMPQLISRLLWSRIGAEEDANIGVDSTGTGMFDGGISASLRDMARVGRVVLGDGVSMTGARVTPAEWIHDTLTGAPDSRQVFADSPTDTRMPGGMYRNQFWIPREGSDVVLALGIHGQMIYVNRPARVVAVKLSSWPVPQDAWMLLSTITAFDTIAAAVQEGRL